MKTSEESKQVQPAARLTITVDPKHKFDGAPVKEPVKASFTGKETLEPQGSPQDPPATLTFIAGRQEGDKGTIQLEQIGKRGIGKKMLEFTVGVADYRIEVLAPLGQMSGLRCNGKEGAWTIELRAEGTSGTITFTLPRGGSSAEAHMVYEVGAGDAQAHWDVTGPVTFVEGDPATLSFGTMRGTVTVKALGQSVSTQNQTVPFVVRLEAGKFCT
jgi:hypothetical protein